MAVFWFFAKSLVDDGRRMQKLGVVQMRMRISPIPVTPTTYGMHFATKPMQFGIVRSDD